MVRNKDLNIMAESEREAKRFLGTYTCIASNGYSEARASAVVSVDGVTERESCCNRASGEREFKTE